MSELLSTMEWHVLEHAGSDDWGEVPDMYTNDRGRKVYHVGLKPALRRLVRLGYIHSRTASYSPIGNYADRRLAPEPYPDFNLVQIQATLTEQGKDLARLVLDR